VPTHDGDDELRAVDPYGNVIRVHRRRDNTFRWRRGAVAGMTDYIAANRANWDERVPIHVASAFYEFERWLRDPRAAPMRTRRPR